MSLDKVCTICHELLDVSYFNSFKIKNRSYYNSYCKKCRNNLYKNKRNLKNGKTPLE